MVSKRKARKQINRTAAARPLSKISQICACLGKCEKYLFKTTSVSAATRPFRPQNPIASKNGTSKKNRSVRGPKIVCKARLQNRGVSGRRTVILDTHWREMAPKLLVSKRFAFFGPLQLDRHGPTLPRRKKNR